MHQVQMSDLAPLDYDEPLVDETAVNRVSEYADLLDRVNRIDGLLTALCLHKCTSRLHECSTLDLLEVKGEFVSLKAAAGAFARHL